MVVTECHCERSEAISGCLKPVMRLLRLFAPRNDIWMRGISRAAYLSEVGMPPTENPGETDGDGDKHVNRPPKEI